MPAGVNHELPCLLEYSVNERHIGSYFAIPCEAAAAGAGNTVDGLTTTTGLGVIMAKRHYNADSAFLLSSSPLPNVRSDVTGCGLMPDVGSIAGSIALLTITIG